MRCAPGLRIFKGPRRPNPDEIIWTQSAEVIAEDRQKDEYARIEDSCGRYRAIQSGSDLYSKNRSEESDEDDAHNLEHLVHAIGSVEISPQFRIKPGENVQ